MTARAKVAVLISGTGTNMAALLYASRHISTFLEGRISPGLLRTVNNFIPVELHLPLAHLLHKI